ncbi:MAG: hypothetical protein ACKO0Z_16465 [Betaproteobacteria bacterium]
MNEDLKGLIKSYNEILKMCSDALAPGVSQEQRTKLKESVDTFLKASQTD